MRSFQDAWAAADIGRIVALLTDDALLTMPPLDMRFRGAATIGEFFSTEPLRAGSTGSPSLSARERPARVGCYADAQGTATTAPTGHGLRMRGERISGITGFPRDPDLFAQLAVPATLE